MVDNEQSYSTIGRGYTRPPLITAETDDELSGPLGKLEGAFVPVPRLRYLVGRIEATATASLRMTIDEPPWWLAWNGTNTQSQQTVKRDDEDFGCSKRRTPAQRIMLWSLDRLLGNRKSTRIKFLESREMKGDTDLYRTRSEKRRVKPIVYRGRVDSIRPRLRAPDPATAALLHGEVKVAAKLLAQLTFG